MARGRKPSVRYWPSRKGGGYFCNMAGKLHELALGPDDSPTGPTYAAALEQFSKLLRLETGKGQGSYLISSLFNQYREHLAEKDKEYDLERLPSFERHAKHFSELYGKMPVRELRVYHFEDWWKLHPTWNKTTRHHAGRHIITCLNWGVRQGYIPANPVDKKLKLPEPERRGREARMPDELCRLLIEKSYSSQFRLFQKILWMTGARPIELRKATAVNYRKGRIIHSAKPGHGYRHKTIRTKRDRVIFLPPEVVPEVEELVRKHPKGPIFLSPRGTPWTKANLHRTWKSLQRQPDVASYLEDHYIDPKSITPYCYRHSMASQWIDSGRSIHVLAELLGTSVAMLERVYGHPDHDRMQLHYEAFLKSDWPTTTPDRSGCVSDVLPLSEAVVPRRAAQG